MGRLITFAEAKTKSLWYFEDSGYNTVVWPSISFPHHVCIHADKINDHPKTRIKLRRFIENNLTDTVIYDVIEKDYYKFFTEDRSWDRKWDVRNSWVRFHFEEGESASIFALAFSDLVQPMTDWHPKYPEDEEWVKLPLSERHYT